MLRERQAVMLELRKLHDSETTASEKLPLLQSAVASLAQNSLFKVQKSEELFENLQFYQADALSQTHNFCESKCKHVKQAIRRAL